MGGTRAQEDPANFARVLAVHLQGAYQMSQAFGRVCIAAGHGGSVINVSSVLGLVGTSAPQAAYAAAKAGLVGLTWDLAIQRTSRRGIRVNPLVPGLIVSDMTAPLMAGSRSRFDTSSGSPTSTQSSSAGRSQSGSRRRSGSSRPDSADPWVASRPRETSGGEGVLIFVAVDDLRATTRRAIACGGGMAGAPTTVAEDIGEYAALDPTGTTSASCRAGWPARAEGKPDQRGATAHEG